MPKKQKLYSTTMLDTKQSPPYVLGWIPRIGREKLLQKLNKNGITEKKLQKYRTKDGYFIPMKGYHLEVRELKKK